MIVAHAASGALLGFVAEGTGQLAGFSFTQDLVLTAIPVGGSMIVALVAGVRRHRGSHAVSDAKRLDEEYHRDLRRQITRLEKQVDDLARKRGGRPLRGDEPDDAA